MAGEPEFDLAGARNRTTGAVDASLAAGVDPGKGGETAGTTFGEWTLCLVAAVGADPSFRTQLLLKRDHMSICDRSPPIKNAATHVPSHTIDASFTPRSFNITIRDAMQGVKRVIVTRATTI